MSAQPVRNCAHCKTAEAVLFVIFTTADDRGVALPYCAKDAHEVVPVLVSNGFEVTLMSAAQLPWLLLCEYGSDECPRTAKRGYRMCPDHLQELEEVANAGKSSGASVAEFRSSVGRGLRLEARR